MEYTFNLSGEQVNRLKSIVMSHNVRLKLSGDWPEEKLDKGIEDIILDVSYQVWRKEGEI